MAFQISGGRAGNGARSASPRGTSASSAQAQERSPSRGRTPSPSLEACVGLEDLHGSRTRFPQDLILWVVRVRRESFDRVTATMGSKAVHTSPQFQNQCVQMAQHLPCGTTIHFKVPRSAITLVIQDFRVRVQEQIELVHRVVATSIVDPHRVLQGHGNPTYGNWSYAIIHYHQLPNLYSSAPLQTEPFPSQGAPQHLRLLHDMYLMITRNAPGLPGSPTHTVSARSANRLIFLSEELLRQIRIVAEYGKVDTARYIIPKERLKMNPLNLEVYSLGESVWRLSWYLQIG